MNLRFLICGMLGLAAIVHAATSGGHPAWLRARRDLRAAQSLLRARDEPGMTRHLVQAEREVEAALAAIDRASVTDGKAADERPRAEASPDARGRLRRTTELLRSARARLAGVEDDDRVRIWRDRVYQHIDRALNHVHRASFDLYEEREPGC